MSSEPPVTPLITRSAPTPMSRNSETSWHPARCTSPDTLAESRHGQADAARRAGPAPARVRGNAAEADRGPLRGGLSSDRSAAGRLREDVGATLQALRTRRHRASD